MVAVGGPDIAAHALLAIGGGGQHAAAVVAVGLPPPQPPPLSLLFSSVLHQVEDATLLLQYAIDDAQQRHISSVPSVLQSWSVWSQPNSTHAVDVTIGEQATLPAPVAAFGSPTRAASGFLVPRWLRIRDVVGGVAPLALPSVFQVYLPLPLRRRSPQLRARTQARQTGIMMHSPGLRSNVELPSESQGH